MNCSRILDMVYEYSDSKSIPLWLQFRINLHTIICPNCAQEIERFKACKDMCDDFSSMEPESSVMARIAAGEKEHQNEEAPDAHNDLSIRGWIIAGVIILVSLLTAFFGTDFDKVALDAGMSFMLPVGITVGVVLTVYGAFLIGSHLSEFRERFGL